jgi:hypothetical protein
MRWRSPPLPAKTDTPPKALPMSTKLQTIKRLDPAEYVAQL